MKFSNNRRNKQKKSGGHSPTSRKNELREECSDRIVSNLDEERMNFAITGISYDCHTVIGPALMAGKPTQETKRDVKYSYMLLF